MGETAKKTRELWIDVCRGIAMILVLVGHNSPPFIRYIYGFHIPMFFIISGYLYKDVKHGEWTRYLWKIFRNYIVPYYLFTFINLILHIIHLCMVAPDVEISKQMIWDYILAIISVEYTGEMPACGLMWFLPSLALTLIIYSLIRFIDDEYIRLIIIIGFVILGKVMENAGFPQLPLKLNTTLFGVLFVECGYLLKKNDLVKTAVQTDRKKITAIICISVLLGLYFIKINTVENWVDIHSQRYGDPLLMPLGAIIVTYGIMVATCYLEDALKKVYVPLSWIGKHTILLLAMDDASNSWGGSVFYVFNIPYSWLMAFVIRSLVMVIFIVLWFLLLKLIRNERIREFLNY